MDIESLHDICKSLPAVTEDIKWDVHLCFSVGGKMFCITSLEDPSVSFKTSDEEFEGLIVRDGFIPAPHLGRYKWVQADDADRLSRQEWEHYLRLSYDLVKEKLPKKLRAEIDAA